jgi:stage V sporulation protein T
VKNVEINSGDNKKKKLLLVIIFLVILLALGFLLKFLFAEPEPEWDDDLSQETLNTITYEGKQYRYNNDLVNILFLGIDNTDMLVGNEVPGEAGQSDCIMLLTLDKSKKEARIMQIPRDTMTEVDIYDTAGNYNTTVTEQIATQYAETLYKTCGLSVIICDRDAVIAAAGVSKREYSDRRLTPEFEEIMSTRSLYTSRENDRLSVIEGGSHYVSCAMPIISDGDIIGCVASLASENSSEPVEVPESKLIQTAASFLGRQTEA